MQKTQAYQLDYVNRGIVGYCRIRIYEELGERPVVIATQERASREVHPGAVGNAAPVIAAHLIRDGFLPVFTINMETRTKSVQGQTQKYVRSQAPFIFVGEYLEPQHRLYCCWFDGYEIYGVVYNGEVENRIGNAFREVTSKERIEDLIGQSL